MAKIGDIVRFLSSTGGGRIVKIDGQIAHVEEEDGFVTPVLLKELVVVRAAGDEAVRADAFGGTRRAKEEVKAKEQSKFVPTQVPEQPKAPVTEETATGNRMNVTLAYLPVELKHLNTTQFEAYLVNDSNYFLYFTYLSRADDEQGWTTRYAGIVEPNIQIYLGEMTGAEVGRLDRVAVQYVAFKRDKEFSLKHRYFDEKVIAVDVVVNDAPQCPMVVDSSSLEDALRQKKEEKRAARLLKKPVKRDSKPGIIEVDLHIGALLDTTAGLSNADILNCQIDAFRKVMDENLRNKGQKIVFIHGKGEGVLRQALMKELTHRYKGNDVQDASFREYGYGATQVTIR